MTEILDSRLFCGMVINAAAAVESRSQEINELNVFPVPDGDTGTNMSMTLNNASRELGKGAPPTLGAAAEVTASAMDHHRILKLKVRLLPEEEEGGEAI